MFSIDKLEIGLYTLSSEHIGCMAIFPSMVSNDGSIWIRLDIYNNGYLGLSGWFKTCSDCYEQFYQMNNGKNLSSTIDLKEYIKLAFPGLT